MSIIIGLLAGMGLPLQTSVNTRLRKRVGSPFNASLVSFTVGFLFLVALLPLTGQSILIPFGKLAGEPAWIWMGGLCGVVFLTANILLFGKLGGVQTVILPVVGQILMGLLVDHFGMFHGAQIALKWSRSLGAVLVVLGVLIVSTARQTEGNKEAEKPGEKAGAVWLWQVFGVGAGMLSAVQTAINGYLGRAMASPAKASVVSFGVGALALAVLCLILKWRNKGSQPAGDAQVSMKPWWMWFGGVLGGLYVLANIFLASLIGTGMTLIVLLIGSTAGGLVIDQTGLAQSPKRPVTLRKILGVVVMLAGAAMIRLL